MGGDAISEALEPEGHFVPVRRLFVFPEIWYSLLSEQAQTELYVAPHPANRSPADTANTIPAVHWPPFCTHLSPITVLVCNNLNIYAIKTRNFFFLGYFAYPCSNTLLVSLK